eukprot:CAMPEP_0168298420 /NCGR_PEP_ID=MMETSP0142_2-20121227/22607_1 /TAXON_ID=44445 /ORGANISM="Pseudo-nitzschia australis, Strain 10249 10 AB" /LENGTH=332 /DNA_ID=CAMNT_0008247819 /DNA_START=190 /DNA_END=1188 /DNA_ORIENTATION=+
MTSVSALSVGNPGPSAARSVAVDAAMESTYQRLAQRAIELYRSNKGTGLDGRCWIGVAGGPGAGKSTLASAVADRINNCAAAALNNNTMIIINNNNNNNNKDDTILKAVAVPMDGYHYTRKELGELSQSYNPADDDGSKGMSRRGAPWTFDAEALAMDLAKAKRLGQASLPEYDRVLSDPVENAVLVEPSHQIVLVEGNYILLGLLEAELDDNKHKPLQDSNLGKACSDLRSPFPIGQEILRWKTTAELWDETWFVSPPNYDNDSNTETAVSIQRDRIIERSLETWTKAKTHAWGGGTDREAAIRRAEFNDVRNAMLVNCCRTYADLIVDSI